MNGSSFATSLVASGLVDDGPDLQAIGIQAAGSDFDMACRLFGRLETPADRLLLAKLYGDSIGKAHIPLRKTLFQRSALEKLSPEAARKLVALPVYMLNDTLTVAMAHPEDARAVAELQRLTGCAVSAIFAFPQEIEDGIDIQYGTSDALEGLSDEVSQSLRQLRQRQLSKLQDLSRQVTDGLAPFSQPNAQQLHKLALSASVTDLVRGMLLYCIQHDASDIHVQPTARSLQVRYRVDGRLQTLLKLSKGVALPVVSRLKILAGLDVAEQYQPQDGRISLELRHQSFDFQLSTVPMSFGEKAVLRASGSFERAVKPIDELGLSARNQQALRRLTKRLHGLLLVSGPAGSGKTSTLYSILSALHHHEINIVTVEDPVELPIDGITQIQTNAAIGLDISHALRAALRQDPEVMAIGEVRDLETAGIAVQAAQTGRLVVASMHANGALQAVGRLADIGVTPSLVASSLIGVLSQRLLRRICEHCKESYEPGEPVLDSLFFNRDDAKPSFFRGRGCAECNNSGYKGRIAIHEILVLTDTIREMIARRAPLADVKQEAWRLGFRPLRYDGLMKALQGQTTLEEVERAAGE